MSEPTVQGEAAEVLFRQRRDGLEAAVAASRTKTAAVVAVAHLDELDLIHDALASVGLLPPRDVDNDVTPPYDPTADLPAPGAPFNYRKASKP